MTRRFYTFQEWLLEYLLVAQRATRQEVNNAPLAQLAEQLTLNQWVRGSIP